MAVKALILSVVVNGYSGLTLRWPGALVMPVWLALGQLPPVVLVS